MTDDRSLSEEEYKRIWCLLDKDLKSRNRGVGFDAFNEIGIIGRAERMQKDLDLFIDEVFARVRCEAEDRSSLCRILAERLGEARVEGITPVHNKDVRPTKEGS